MFCNVSALLVFAACLVLLFVPRVLQVISVVAVPCWFVSVLVLFP